MESMAKLLNHSSQQLPEQKHRRKQETTWISETTNAKTVKMQRKTNHIIDFINYGSHVQGSWLR